MEEDNEIIDKEEQSSREIIPGTYTIDENGVFHRVPNWQTAIDQIKWEEVTNLIESLTKRGTSERIANISGMYGLVLIVVLTAGFLSFKDIIDGQAISVFLGAAIGYLLSRANFR